MFHISCLCLYHESRCHTTYYDQVQKREFSKWLKLLLLPPTHTNFKSTSRRVWEKQSTGTNFHLCQDTFSNWGSSSWILKDFAFIWSTVAKRKSKSRSSKWNQQVSAKRLRKTTFLCCLEDPWQLQIYPSILLCYRPPDCVHYLSTRRIFTAASNLTST